MKNVNQYLGLDKKEYLRKLVSEGISKKYDISIKSKYDEINKRLEYELNNIFEKNFKDNILAAYEIVEFAKNSDIIVGPGCGIVGGSLVCYVLGITDIDPIKYNLSFERFVNINTHSVPYIYIEIPVSNLEMMKNFIRYKYNNPLVSCENHEEVESVDTIKIIQSVEFLNIIIRGNEFLDKINICKKLIFETYGEKIDLNNISLNDEKIYKMINIGDTKGVFQIDDFVKNFMINFKPNNILDIATSISVCIPGPSKYIHELINNKNQKQNIKKVQAIYDNILRETYGILIYQEQVFEILNKIFHVPFSEVNSIKRAMCLKKMNEVDKVKKDYIYGNDKLNIKSCINDDINEEVANKIFDNMVNNAAFTTCKAHAIGYAIIVYQTAYLKYYYNDIFKTVCVQK